jgi:hypothetical protein
VDQEKRRLRKIKRDLKRKGNKRRRRHLKRDLADRPEHAPFSDFDFGRYSSAPFNGIDQDPTRRKPQSFKY